MNNATPRTADLVALAQATDSPAYTYAEGRSQIGLLLQ
jgi:hypothetical protein